MSDDKQLEIIILSQSEREIQILYDTLWNLRYDTNESIHETQTDLQTYRADLWVPSRGLGGG